MQKSPEVWGPSVWKTIHFICAGAPEFLSDIDKMKYSDFLLGLQYVIPCESCREHLKENLNNVQLLDPVLNSRESLFKWSVDLHNTVNKMLNKPEVSLEQAKQLVKDGFKKSDKPVVSQPKIKKSVTVWILISIIVLLLLIVILQGSRLVRK